jgi:hypothetical protein
VLQRQGSQRQVLHRALLPPQPLLAAAGGGRHTVQGWQRGRLQLVVAQLRGGGQRVKQLCAVLPQLAQLRVQLTVLLPQVDDVIPFGLETEGL